MPTVYAETNWKITMYAFDHNPPHFHVVTPDGEAQVRIDDLEVLRTSLPDRAIRDAVGWAASHKDVLSIKWIELHRV